VLSWEVRLTESKMASFARKLLVFLAIYFAEKAQGRSERSG